MDFFKNFYKEDKIVGLCAFKRQRGLGFKFTANEKQYTSSFFGGGKFTPNMFR